jgi:hypothetical protein
MLEKFWYSGMYKILFCTTTQMIMQDTPKNLTEAGSHFALHG